MKGLAQFWPHGEMLSDIKHCSSRGKFWSMGAAGSNLSVLVLLLKKSDGSGMKDYVPVGSLATDLFPWPPGSFAKN